MKTVYLHIGSPKTGTTQLQATFQRSSDYLATIGIAYLLYPFRNGGEHGLAFALRSQKGLPNYVTDVDVHSFDVVSEYYLEVIRCSSAEKIVISSESFFGTAKERPESIKLLATMFRNYRVKIIVYLRRQDKFFEANFSQNVKVDRFVNKPAAEVIATIQQRQGYNYFEHLAPWDKYFGRQNIVVRPFESEQLFNADIVQDFLNILGADTSVYSGLNIGKQKNITPPSEVILFMNKLNHLPMAPAERKSLYKDIIAFAACSNFAIDKPLIDAQRRKEFLDSFLPSNRKIEKYYLPRETRLFSDFEFSGNEADRACDESDMASFANTLPASILTRILMEACSHHQT